MTTLFLKESKLPVVYYLCRFCPGVQGRRRDEDRMSPQNASYSGAVPGAELWRHSLRGISSAFGRLAHLASLRDTQSGRYHDRQLASVVGPEDADRILRRSHYQAFAQWLVLGLAEQVSDLDEFFRESGPQQEFRFREMPPSNARDVELKLYLTDLEMVLELLRCQREVPSPARV
jgi:hypothetical protein